jgi:hypothetical protein
MDECKTGELHRFMPESCLRTVPDAVIGVIAKYLQPPEVYNLLTVLDYDRKNFNGWKSLAAYFNPPSRAILAESLEKSLKRVIKSNKVSFREDIDMYASFTKLAEELAQSQGTRPRLSLGLTNGLHRGSPAVAVSGGIMVQAALGETWGDSDVDIYCTEAAAPSVRAWLINEMKQVLVGVNSRYGTYVPYSIKDPVDHVEYWANTPVDGERFKIGKYIDWEFDYKRACRNSPVGFQGSRVFDGAEPMDDDFHGVLMRTKGNIPVPFEANLLCVSDDEGVRKTKKEIVSIDLIVVKSGCTIASVIHGFDFGICQCAWDGLGLFFVPAPGSTFCRMSNLSYGHQVNEMLLYAKCITVESKKTSGEMMKELQSFNASLLASHLKHIKSIKNEEHADLLLHLQLVIDKFNVFSPEFDRKLPVEVLLLTRELREMLIQNVLERPGAHGHHAHNLIMKSMERLEKYERRGITFTPRPSPCDALRTLPTSAPRPLIAANSINFAAAGASTSTPSWIETVRSETTSQYSTSRHVSIIEGNRMDHWATSEHRINRSVALKPVARSSYLQRWENYRQLVLKAQQKEGSAGALVAVVNQGVGWKKRKALLPLLPDL